MQSQHIFNIEKFVLLRYFQRKTNLFYDSKFADSLSHWKFNTQTRFSSPEMCVFLKNEGQKMAFHTCTSSVKRNSKFDKCFSPKSKLNRNLIRFDLSKVFFGESMFHGEVVVETVFDIGTEGESDVRI